MLMDHRCIVSALVLHTFEEERVYADDSWSKSQNHKWWQPLNVQIDQYTLDGKHYAHLWRQTCGGWLMISIWKGNQKKTRLLWCIKRESKEEAKRSTKHSEPVTFCYWEGLTSKTGLLSGSSFVASLSNRENNSGCDSWCFCCTIS